MKGHLSDSLKEKIRHLFESFKTRRFNQNDYDKVFGNERKFKNLFSKDALKEFVDYIPWFIDMVKDYTSGKYKEVPWATIAAIVGTLLYVLSPVDFVMDIIPVLGLLDDAFMMALCVRCVSIDIDKYKQWKENQARLNSAFGEN